MRIAITGATGFLGRPLVAHLETLGYECLVLTRDMARAAALGFSPSVRILPVEPLPPCEAVIHLAGESVVGLWTARKRRVILESRVQGTRRLVAALRSAKVRPHTLLCASAVGFYGDRPGELLEEDSSADPRGSFRAQVCTAWEDAAREAEVLGLRVMQLRIGNVLDPSGGYLGGLLPIYRQFGGVVFGENEAAIPWIARPDAIRLISFALANERWYGPLNITAPTTVTQREFATAISQRVGPGWTVKVPRRLVRGVLGDFASALIDDQHVVPAKAIAAGFRFQHPDFGAWVEAAFPVGVADPFQ